MNMRFGALIAALVIFGAAIAPPALAKDDCRQPAQICETRSAVFRISAFDPVGSAVRIGPDLLVTSRHVVAHQEMVDLFLRDGSKLSAKVLPTAYEGDIILLQTDGLGEGAQLKFGKVAKGGNVYTVGADVSRRRIRAYRPGKVRFLPAEGKPLARIHHSAYTQQGNSGGALLNEDGELVGIAASGGEGRFEAVPASAVRLLIAERDEADRSASLEIGTAVRICTLNLERHYGSRRALNDQEATALATSCRRTGNRQYFDLAGQILSQRRRLEPALELFMASVDQDPNAINSRLNLVITHHIARRYEEELPHLRWLMEHAGNDLQVLRFAIQAGVWTDNMELAKEALTRMKAINPNAAPAAERFMNSPPPRPPAN